MKSSIKIDYERSYENDPIIKIVVPKESPSVSISLITGADDEDVRDKLVKDFLHSPMKTDRNTLFEAKTYFSTNDADITTIGAVKYENIMYKLRHIVLNRLVTENDIQLFNSKVSVPNDTYNKVHEFFDWVDGLEKQIWEAEKTKIPETVK